MLEIGSYEGRSAHWFLENVCETIDCVDPFKFDDTIGLAPPPDIEIGERIKEEFEANLGQFNTRVKLFEMTSEAFLFGGWSEFYSERPIYDGAYVDGCHATSVVLMDLVGVWTFLRPGGLLLVDDLQIREPDRHVERAWEAFEACYRSRYHLVGDTDRQICIRKLQ